MITTIFFLLRAGGLAEEVVGDSSVVVVKERSEELANEEAAFPAYKVDLLPELYASSFCKTWSSSHEIVNRSILRFCCHRTNREVRKGKSTFERV